MSNQNVKKNRLLVLLVKVDRFTYNTPFVSTFLSTLVLPLNFCGSLFTFFLYICLFRGFLLTIVHVQRCEYINDYFKLNLAMKYFVLIPPNVYVYLSE